MVGSDIKIKRDPQTKVRRVWTEKFICSPRTNILYTQRAARKFCRGNSGRKNALVEIERVCVSGVYKLYKQRRSLTHSQYFTIEMSFILVRLSV